MISWTHYDIYTEEDLDKMCAMWHASKPIATAFDTETTGLHIMYDTPFMFQFGWYCGTKGVTFVVDDTDKDLFIRVITIWQIFVERSPIDLGHNIKFDLHMLYNIGVCTRRKNIADTSFFIRLGADAIAERHGGAPMKLKDFAAKYICSDAKYHEAELAKERSDIAQKYNLQLQKRLNEVSCPPEEWGYKSWTKACLKKFFDDKTNEVSDLPEEFRQTYLDWHEELPNYLQEKVTGYVESEMIRYSDLNRETLRKYGHLDVVWTLETYIKMNPVLVSRGNTITLQLERDNIYNLLDMERVGFLVDIEYLHNAKSTMRNYIKRRREDLCRQAGQELSVSQSALIVTILHDNFNLCINSSGADVLDLEITNLKRLGNNESAIEFIETVQELRTLEKWYSTYIARFMWEVSKGDRIYTSVNSTGTVSGRVTSDFQQFPKDAILGIDGEELFCPRRMVLAKDKDHIGIVYLDYSQIELRLQAMFTILVGHADKNLCRAYMPYECVDEDLNPFDYSNKEHIKSAYTKQWYLSEDPTTVWTPTDVHGATTKHAFDIDENDEHYKKLRYVGKRVNFAKNYGAQYGKISSMFPEFTPEQCRKIDEAYYLAFPGVKLYHAYCERIALERPYAVNLFGRRYYGVSGHNLKNMLVQGTGADFLKIKIKEVCEYLHKVNARSKFVMQIHDELQFYWHKDDSLQVFEEVKHIMEQWEDGLIPIVADMEVSTTNWKEKFEVEDGITESEIRARN